jgi:hypothetical protein
VIEGTSCSRKPFWASCRPVFAVSSFAASDVLGQDRLDTGLVRLGQRLLVDAAVRRQVRLAEQRVLTHQPLDHRDGLIHLDLADLEGRGGRRLVRLLGADLAVARQAPKLGGTVDLPLSRLEPLPLDVDLGVRRPEGGEAVVQLRDHLVALVQLALLEQEALVVVEDGEPQVEGLGLEGGDELLQRQLELGDPALETGGDQAGGEALAGRLGLSDVGRGGRDAGDAPPRRRPRS